jgi:hypothetical protein
VGLSSCGAPCRPVPLATSAELPSAPCCPLPLAVFCPLLYSAAGCDFSNKDLSGKVFSGVLLQGADLSNTKVVGSQFARAQAQGAVMVNTDFTDTNLYGT